MALLPNQTVELTVQTDSGIEVFKTRVEDVSETSVLVAAPLRSGQVVPIRPETKLKILYNISNISYQGKFVADAVVVRRITGRIPCLLLSIISPWSRTQERAFVRVDVLLDASYAPIRDGRAEKARDCIIKNISGGGVMFFATEELQESSVVWLAIPLDNGQIVQSQGRIVRRKPDDKGYAYGVSFLDIDRKDQQAVIQFVFRKQLELRKKGILGRI